MAGKPRPAARAQRLPDPGPATEFSPLLLDVCASGERAVTVFAERPSESSGEGPVRAALGSPADPEAFSVWRAQGVYVFLAGDLPTHLALELGPGARLTGTARY